MFAEYEVIKPWVFDAYLAGSKSTSGFATTSATLKLTISAGDELAARFGDLSLPKVFDASALSLTGDGAGTYEVRGFGTCASSEPPVLGIILNCFFEGF